MRETEAEIEGLRGVNPGVEAMSEGGSVFAFLPRFRFRAGGTVQEMDALLCPCAHSGYETRLFLERIVPGYGGAWYPLQVLGRPWQAISWSGVTPEQPWTKILAEHLAAFA